MVEAAMAGVFLLWWTGLIRFRAWMPMPSAFDIHLAATWAPFYVPVILYAVAEIAIDILALARPGWARLVAGLSLARYVAACALTILLLKLGHWVDVAAPHAPAHAVELMTRGFDQWIRFALMASFVVYAIKGGLDAWRLYRLCGGQARNGDSAVATFFAG
jgi:hypothetical protein